MNDGKLNLIVGKYEERLRSALILRQISGAQMSANDLEMLDVGIDMLKDVVYDLKNL